MEPVLDVSRSWFSGIVASADVSTAIGVAGSIVGVVVRGRSVIDVGRWPPREKVVRGSRRWPCSDLGSVIV
jgi:hypothetical protein